MAFTGLKRFWRNLNGLRKKRYITGIYFLIMFAVLTIYYLHWLPNRPTNVNGNANEFAKDQPLIFIFLAVYAAAGIFLGFYQWNKRELINFIASKHKERIRLLHKFSSESFWLDGRSIYDSILELLKRCEEELKLNTSNKKLKVKMLLCSPLIDYPSRIKCIDEWGEEIKSILDRIISHKSSNVEVEIYYLSDKTYAGINPLNNFNEVLSGYVEANNSSFRKEIVYNAIKLKTDNFIKALELFKDTNENLTVNTVSLIDVPYQIFLYEAANDINEVIVSFSGKKQLESAIEHFPKGFHSVDDEVVSAFSQIFKSCTETHRRRPIKPHHTIEIINNLNKQHKVTNYLNKGIQIEIPKECFSPAYANSSKFTSYVIEKTLLPNHKVLEIGAGSGVQSIFCFKHMLENGNKTPVVYSIEPFPDPFKALQNNLNINNLLNPPNCIVPKKFFLGFENGNKILESSEYSFSNELINGTLFLKDGNINRKVTEDDFDNKVFNYVVADLPYVDCKLDSTPSHLDHSFYDENHAAHQCLFSFFANSKIFTDDALLITSFSTLGGFDDLMEFYKIINLYGLHSMQEFVFSEDDYLWYVHIISKEKSIDNHKFWRNKLYCKPD